MLLLLPDSVSHGAALRQSSCVLAGLVGAESSPAAAFACQAVFCGACMHAQPICRTQLSCWLATRDPHQEFPPLECPADMLLGGHDFQLPRMAELDVRVEEFRPDDAGHKHWAALAMATRLRRLSLHGNLVRRGQQGLPPWHPPFAQGPATALGVVHGGS